MSHPASACQPTAPTGNPADTTIVADSRLVADAALVADENVVETTSTPEQPSSEDDLSQMKNQAGSSEKHVATDETVHYVTGIKLVGLMASTTLAVFLMILDMSIIVTAIPKITTDFHSLPDVGWYASAYTLASSALQPLTGKFYTYFKTKWTFLTFVAVFELGSLICGLAASSNMLIIGRAVAGMGSSGIMNGGLTIIAMATPLEKRPVLVGIMMGFCQLGLIAGPLVGGALTQFTTWRWCFFINLPIGGVACLLIILLHFPDRRVKVDGSLFRTLRSKLDLTGFVLFAPSAVMILLAVQWGGNEYPWNSATVIGLFCGGVVTGCVFMMWETRQGVDAMIPPYIIRRRPIYSACLTMFFLFCSVFVFSYYLPIYFQSVKNKTPFESGVGMLPSIIPQLVTGVATGFVMQRVGYYVPFGVSCATVATVGYGLMTTFTVDTSTAKWAGIQVIVGVGRGLGMQVAILAIQANTEPAVTPVATAVLVFSQTFGGSIVTAIAEAVFNNKLKSQLEARVPYKLAAAVIEAGARGVRDVTPPEFLPEVLKSYVIAVDDAFYIAMAATVGMFVVVWGTGWKDIRKKKQPKAGDA